MRSPDLELIGIWMLIVGSFVILFELALMGYWTARLARRAQTLNEQVTLQQTLLQADIERLRANLAETQVLWQPYRRLLRLLRHPLTIALMQSFARRIAG
ncbi:MAG TPA: hypothetical protein VFR33_00435 [Candidatus Dormibacteraeota bacterium]|nr:hypothetical protein [Candidatus Dormibacteraeota bacterium]